MIAIGFLGYNTSPICWVEIISLDIFNFDLPVESLVPLSNPSLKDDCTAELPSPASAKLQTILQNHNLNPFAVFENLHAEGAKSLAYAFLKPFSRSGCLLNSKFNNR